MPEMSILIVALLGFAGGFLLSRRGSKTTPEVRADAEVARERAVVVATEKHAAAVEAIENDKRADDTGDVADRLNNLAKRGEVRK